MNYGTQDSTKTETGNVSVYLVLLNLGNKNFLKKITILF